MSAINSQRTPIPSYEEIAKETFGTLWQEAQPADWALVVHYMRTAPKQSGPEGEVPADVLEAAHWYEDADGSKVGKMAAFVLQLAAAQRSATSDEGR